MRKQHLTPLFVLVVTSAAGFAEQAATDFLPAPEKWGETVDLNSDAASKAETRGNDSQLPICARIVPDSETSTVTLASFGGTVQFAQHSSLCQKNGDAEAETSESSLTSGIPVDAFSSCGPVTPPTITTDTYNRTVAFTTADTEAPPIAPIPETDARFRSADAEFLRSTGNTSGWVGCGQACCPRSSVRCVSDECGRGLTGYFGGVFLNRSAPDGRSLAYNAAAGGGSFNAADFDFGTQGGIEAGLIAHQAACDLDFEIRFLSVDDWSENLQQRLNGPVTVIGTGVPLALPGARNVRAEYESSLRNVEANFRYRYGGGWNWLTLTAGFRYLNISESLDTQFSDPAAVLPTDSAAADTKNSLYGFQLGLDKTICGNCGYSIEAYGRAGVYGNHSQVETNVTAPGGLTPGFNTSEADNSAAFVGELGVKASYVVLDGLRVFGRYSVLAVDGVALASDQLAATNPLTRRGHNANGDLFYHGATAGIEFIF